MIKIIEFTFWLIVITCKIILGFILWVFLIAFRILPYSPEMSEEEDEDLNYKVS
jgi:hypothetical protein